MSAGVQGRCSGTNRDGGPCAAPVLPGETRCAWHHPAMRERVAAGRAKGGARRSNASRARRQLLAEAMTLREVQAVLCRALRRVEAGELEPGPANALSSLGRAIAAVAQAGDLEERLGELERAAGATKGRWA